MSWSKGEGGVAKRNVMLEPPCSLRRHQPDQVQRVLASNLSADDEGKRCLLQRSGHPDKNSRSLLRHSVSGKWGYVALAALDQLFKP